MCFQMLCILPPFLVVTRASPAQLSSETSIQQKAVLAAVKVLQSSINKPWQHRPTTLAMPEVWGRAVSNSRPKAMIKIKA